MPAPAWRLDHAVVFVSHLTPAIDVYRRQGFAVRRGGRHRGVPTRNALIGLGDGAYLELLAPARPLLRPCLRALRAARLLHRALRGRPPVERRFLQGLAGPTALGDYCLWTDALDRAVTRARAAGIAVDGPWAMSRVRPDGRRLEWRLALPAGAGMPFLIEDRTPRSQRVPPDRSPPGAIGPVRIAEIGVRVADVPRAAKALGLLLGAQPVDDAAGVCFRLGATRLVFSRLEGRGHGRPRFTMAVALDGEPPPPLAAVARHGIRLVDGSSPAGPASRAAAVR